MAQKRKEVRSNKRLNTIDEYDLSSQESAVEQGGDNQEEASPASDILEFKKQHELNLNGPLIVADDQHINIEILKQQTLNLGIQD